MSGVGQREEARSPPLRYQPKKIQTGGTILNKKQVTLGLVGTWLTTALGTIPKLAMVPTDTRLAGGTGWSTGSCT